MGVVECSITNDDSFELPILGDLRKDFDRAACSNLALVCVGPISPEYEILWQTLQSVGLSVGVAPSNVFLFREDVAKRLREAGVVVYGCANMSESEFVYAIEDVCSFEVGKSVRLAIDCEGLIANRTCSQDFAPLEFVVDPSVRGMRNAKNLVKEEKLKQRIVALSDLISEIREFRRSMWSRGFIDLYLSVKNTLGRDLKLSIVGMPENLQFLLAIPGSEIVIIESCPLKRRRGLKLGFECVVPESEFTCGDIIVNFSSRNWPAMWSDLREKKGGVWLVDYEGIRLDTLKEAGAVFSGNIYDDLVDFKFRNCFVRFVRAKWFAARNLPQKSVVMDRDLQFSAVALSVLDWIRKCGDSKIEVGPGLRQPGNWVRDKLLELEFVYYSRFYEEALCRG